MVFAAKESNEPVDKVFQARRQVARPAEVLDLESVHLHDPFKN
jgi:hypothetical protein